MSLSLRHQLVGGLQHESGLRWHVIHDIDLGSVEIANINDALSMLSAAGSIAVNPNGDISKAVSVSA